MSPETTRPWIAAHEGYYGPPLTVEARRDLVAWLARHDYDGYVYSPKDDPYQRERWRDPYPPEALAPLHDVAAACRDHGLDAGLTISPGLDWRLDDANEVDRLITKVEQLLAAGATCVGIAWDDVPGEGARVGADHGRAVASVVARLGRDRVRWLTCPVDYAVTEPTDYLRAFAAEIGDGVDLIWTGPSVVTPHLGTDQVTRLADALGRPLLFAENFPVNDLGMSGVLHVGPYPARDPEAMAGTRGVLVNFMSHPRASRVGLALAARAWRDPDEDRIAAWRDVITETPGLEPLARACRSWSDDPGPDPELVAWADEAGAGDTRLRTFLAAGCRDHLDPDLAAEVEPWLAAWEREAEVMHLALRILERDVQPTVTDVWTLARTWQKARRERHQAFGVRFAMYPSTRRDGDRLVAGPDAVIDRDNLTDGLVRRVLEPGRCTGPE